MRFPILSFRTQIVFLVLFLLISSVLFFRYFFLESFHDYSTHVQKLEVGEKINRLYQDYSVTLDGEEREKFKEDIEAILATEWQRKMAGELYKKEVTLYSKFIFVFLSIFVLAMFFFSFSLTTRPLNRLQSATEELSRGNWNIQVKESKFSPLNDLIVSFNSMIKELESNRNKLIQAEKEMVWRDMARVMAHEIKNPLTPIRLSIERLENKYQSRSKDLDEVFNNVVSVIHEEIENLQSLATEFSQFARLPEADFSTYDLNDQLNEIIEPYKNQTEFQMNLSNDFPPIYADKGQMKQVWVNLIQNAIQSSNINPCITISTTCNNSNIVVIIKDNGNGISKEDLGKIFNPYFSRRERGTGLGLAIVKRIVEQHNGTISVESKLGQGTKFVLTFPQTKS